jgi:hypothetical protein
VRYRKHDKLGGNGPGFVVKCLHIFPNSSYIAKTPSALKTNRTKHNDTSGFFVVFPSPLFTPGLKTAPEGMSTRRAPPCSSSTCLGWTWSLAGRHSLQSLAVRTWLLSGLARTARAREARLGPSHCGVAGGGAWELAACGNTPLYCLTTCFAVSPPREGPSHPT